MRLNSFRRIFFALIFATSSLPPTAIPEQGSPTRSLSQIGGENRMGFGLRAV